MPTNTLEDQVLTPEDHDDIKAEAKEKLRAELKKAAVKERLEVLRARKPHFFPKKVVFQWPVRFEEWLTIKK